MTEPTDGQIRARLGLVALCDLDGALGDLRRLITGLHVPGADAALDRAWSALGAAEGALRQLAGEPADEPPAPGC